MHANGEGINQDYKQAMNWYRKAAEQGNSEAQYNLGVMYATGDGISKDYKKAVSLYLKSLFRNHY